MLSVVASRPMPLVIDGRQMFPIGEALAEAGISRATYFRWIRLGRVNDGEYSDRNGRRILTLEEVQYLKKEAQQLIEHPRQLRIPTLEMR
jgi:hypothetical protein